MDQPSCYIVELSVDPGGARRGDVYVYARVEHVRRIVEQEFKNENVAWVEMAHSLIEYGERTLVWPVNAGMMGEPLDLQKFLSWHDDHFDLDWPGIEANLPKLTGELLRAGQRITLDDPDGRADAVGSYLAITLDEELSYGYSDLEGGEEPPPEWQDPDPPGAGD